MTRRKSRTVRKAPSPLLNARQLFGAVKRLYNAYVPGAVRRSGGSDPRRSIEDECGYPSDYEHIDCLDYQRAYDRDDVAARVVEVFPKECWQVLPEVYEDSNPEVNTPFEDAWRQMCSHLRPGTRLVEDSPTVIWDYMLKADVLSGIGRFGVILLGISDLARNDELSFADEVDVSPQNELMYLRCFQEPFVCVKDYEEDMSSPRYGLPKTYSVTIEDPAYKAAHQTRSGLPYQDRETVGRTLDVHWQRIIHIADNTQSNQLYGLPRMEPVWKRLQDLKKLYGGSAEMYWKGAFFGLGIETPPDLGDDIELDEASIKSNLEEYMNGLQRHFVLQGGKINPISPQVVDPTPQIERQIEAICINLGCPKQVFMGSQVGDRTSSMQYEVWADRVRARQRLHLTPVVSTFVDRLISVGILPTPDSYRIFWPDLDVQTEKEKAEVQYIRTQAAGLYTTSRIEKLISRIDYLNLYQGIELDEARRIVEGTEGEIEITPPSNHRPNVVGNEEVTDKKPCGCIGNEEDSLEEIDWENLEEVNTQYFYRTPWDTFTEDDYGSETTLVTNAELPKGRKLNKPFKTPGASKKFAVYVKNDKGNIVIVRFGDPDMEIKRDDPERRKSFRARHNCDDPGPKWKARYWSCRFWSTTPVSKLVNEDEQENQGQE